MDADPAKVDALNRGVLPFYEPGLEPLLRAGLKSGRLSFTTSYVEVAAFGDLHFICVGTPQRPGSGHADLSQVHGCLRALGTLLDRPCLVVASPPCRLAELNWTPPASPVEHVRPYRRQLIRPSDDSSRANVDAAWVILPGT